MVVGNRIPECVGLIPAAGTADRVSPLPCSKEIFPIGSVEIGTRGRQCPKAVAHYLLEQMKLARAKYVYVVLSKNKWDIPAYFKDGAIVEMPVAYLVTGSSYGVPFTVDGAFPFLKDKWVLFGFPDIILKPDDVYIRLLDQMKKTHVDIVLGLFPAVNPQKMDMVVLDDHDAISGIDIKPTRTNLYWTWITAVWNTKFTRYMHDYVACEREHITRIENQDGLERVPERFVGDVIRKAIGSGLKIDKVEFPEGRYIDIGTPEDMKAAIKTFALGL